MSIETNLLDGFSPIKRIYLSVCATHPQNLVVSIHKSSDNEARAFATDFTD